MCRLLRDERATSDPGVVYQGPRKYPLLSWPPFPARKPGTMGSMAERLTGVIERVTFHNPETGFAVLRVRADGRRGQVTVVGQVPRAIAGEYVEASGSWTQ